MLAISADPEEECAPSTAQLLEPMLSSPPWSSRLLRCPPCGVVFLRVLFSDQILPPSESAAPGQGFPITGVSHSEPTTVRYWNIGSGNDSWRLFHRLLEQRLTALQRVEHREQREDRILRLPRLGSGPQDDVFKRRRFQRRDAGIDAGGIRFEQGAVFGSASASARCAIARIRCTRAC